MYCAHSEATSHRGGQKTRLKKITSFYTPISLYHFPQKGPDFYPALFVPFGEEESSLYYFTLYRGTSSKAKETLIVSCETIYQLNYVSSPLSAPPS